MDSEAGPSGIKRPKLRVRNEKNLTESELENILLESEDEKTDPYEDSGSDWANDGSDYDSSDADSLHEMDEHNDTGDQDNDVADLATTVVARVPTLPPVPVAPNWQDISAGLNDIAFLKRNELLVDLPGNEPIDFFLLLLDQNILDKIVEHTNQYAFELFCDKAETERSRISQWKDLTVPELLKFIGLIMHTGTIRINRYQDYWKQDRLFNLTCFSAHMSRDRFLLILRCLHFAKNPSPTDPKPNDRLYKIRGLIDYFNEKICEIYYPGKQLSLDESMVLWRGRLVFRQYIQNKRHKYGIKLYMLTEPNGLVLKFLVYTGQLDDMGGKGHVDKVVLHLLQEKLNNGHSVFMDNFYNSFALAKKLLAANTYCTGTLRLDRRDNPGEVVKAKLKKGETVCKYAESVMIGKWKDKRDVSYISTEFENNMVKLTTKRGEEKSKPLPILEYNKYMSGIDRQDQMMAYYPSTHKTIRWYKKLAIHIFHIALLNSFHLYNKYSGKKSNFYDYRLQVIKALLPETVTPHATPKPKPSLEHFPSKITAKNLAGRIVRKRCKMCHQNKIRKESLYYCNICPDQPGLCITHCFVNYHKRL